MEGGMERRIKSWMGVNGSMDGKMDGWIEEWMRGRHEQKAGWGWRDT